MIHADLEIGARGCGKSGRALRSDGAPPLPQSSPRFETEERVPAGWERRCSGLRAARDEWVMVDGWARKMCSQAFWTNAFLPLREGCGLLRGNLIF